jgi:hypothetical protein
MWWRRSSEPDETRAEYRSIGIMLMEMNEKLDRIVSILEDEDGWEEEEETDRP